MSQDERELVRRAAAGDKAAQRRLLPDPFILELFTFASWRIHAADDAEEVVMEALAAAVQSLLSFRGESSFRTWVYGFVKNKIREYRRRRLLEYLPEEDLDLRPATGSLYRDPLLMALEDEGLRVMNQALQDLSPDEQKAFRHYRLEGRPAREVARLMGRTEAGVTSLVQRAVVKMRRALEEYYAERRVCRHAGSPEKEVQP